MLRKNINFKENGVMPTHCCTGPGCLMIATQITCTVNCALKVTNEHNASSGLIVLKHVSESLENTSEVWNTLSIYA